VTKALIVGGGIAGLATAWALARRGYQVDLFEQGPLPNPKSSSYDEHRITRHAYGAMEGYAHLMPEAFRLWNRLFEATGRVHYDPCGAVYFLRHDSDWYDGVSRSLTAMDIPFRDIPLDQIERRFPMVDPAGLLRAVETEGAGMLFPIRILTDLVVLLPRLGVRLHTTTHIADIDPERATLVANGATHEADVLVIAAGAWADRLVPAIKGVAIPSRQAVLYLAPPPDLADAWATAPVMLDVRHDGGLYTLPPRNGTRLKVGDHVFSRTGDPDEDRIATGHDLERLWPAARETYRDLDRYTVLEPKACFYTVTEHEEFIVQPFAAAAWVVSACSGHGFKLGALIGELAARGISGEVPAADITALAAGRVLHPTWRQDRAAA